MSLFSFARMGREYFLILCPLVGLSALAWIVTVQHMGGAGFALMMVMFIMGTMNLVWMGALSITILLEKSLPFGPPFGRGVGAALIALGITLSMRMLA